VGSHKQFKYLHGVVLPQICLYMGIPDNKITEASKEINQAFKSYVNINSLKKLDVSQMESYLSMIRVLCCREKGWIINEPNENLDIENIGMRLFLKHKLHEEKL
jgi:ABC-type transport system involved in cytochrome c biogenesis ATPase subunit